VHHRVDAGHGGQVSGERKQRRLGRRSPGDPAAAAVHRRGYVHHRQHAGSNPAAVAAASFSFAVAFFFAAAYGCRAVAVQVAFETSKLWNQDITFQVQGLRLETRRFQAMGATEFFLCSTRRADGDA
jgi:hypothetical protein